MSLLNNALKAAEQRQGRPVTPSAYTGHSSVARRRRSWGSALCVAAVILGAGVGGYFFLSPSAPDETIATAAASELHTPTVSEAEPVIHVATVEPVADPLPASARNPDGHPPQEPVTPTVTDEPKVSQSSLGQPQPGTAASRMTVAEVRVPAPASSQPQEEAVVAVDQPEERLRTTPVDIKQARKTPEQRDRDTRDELENLIDRGDLGAAERVLAALTEEQAGPLSRYTVARSLLVSGEPDKALRWVPEGFVSSYPDLRLIRARALLAKHNLDAAVSTLSASVPPVRGHVEYRVTLATLLQQQGRNGAAAGHWAELIAWDDSQAPWWVGLAIALEGRGDLPAARRAYEQAAVLPGLAPSLADYVRQRLQTLRAG